VRQMQPDCANIVVCNVLVNAGVFEIAAPTAEADVNTCVKIAKNRRRIGVVSGVILGPGIIVLAVND